jgi:hypothetical protein
MRIAVRLVFVVVGAKANEIFLDQKLQVSFLIECLASGNTDIVTADPLVNDRSWNADGDVPVSKSSAEFIAINYFKFVREIVFVRSAKSNRLLDGARPAERFDFRPAEPKPK